jgi:transcriptional regulator with XRE-family HTH domain
MLQLRIREIRLWYGWTQATLAAKCHLSRPFISAAERGEADPKLSQLAKLAEGLGVHPRDLLVDCCGTCSHVQPPQRHAQAEPIT